MADFQLNLQVQAEFLEDARSALVSRQLINIMGEKGVDILMDTQQQPNTDAVNFSAPSTWPVDTGLSRNSFDYHRQGRDTIVFTNDVDYAEDVEQRTGAATDTVESNLQEIADAGDDYLSKRFKRGTS